MHLRFELPMQKLCNCLDLLTSFIYTVDYTRLFPYQPTIANFYHFFNGRTLSNQWWRSMCWQRVMLVEVTTFGFIRVDAKVILGQTASPGHICYYYCSFLAECNWTGLLWIWSQSSKIEMVPCLDMSFPILFLLTLHNVPASALCSFVHQQNDLGST